MTTTLSPRLKTTDGSLRRLAELMTDEQYDEKFLRPTLDAFEKAKTVLVEARNALPSGVPTASPAPVGDGGILIQWSYGARTVFVAVPTDPSQGYVYLRGPDYRRTIRDVTGEAVASSIRWLLEE